MAPGAGAFSRFGGRGRAPNRARRAPTVARVHEWRRCRRASAPHRVERAGGRGPGRLDLSRVGATCGGWARSALDQAHGVALGRAARRDRVCRGYCNVYERASQALCGRRMITIITPGGHSHLRNHRKVAHELEGRGYAVVVRHQPCHISTCLLTLVDSKLLITEPDSVSPLVLGTAGMDTVLIDGHGLDKSEC